MKELPRGARAVVTGGGSGLGRALCNDLAGRGARVLVTDVNLPTAEETAEMLRCRGCEAHAMQVDVRKPEQVEAMARKASELWGGTDVLVNNAGLAVVGELGKIPVEEWQFQVDVNLMGVIWGCHYFGPEMVRRGSGFLLNVASAAGLLAAPMMGPYNVTKAGVIALSETLFVELGPAGVHVSVLCPTFLRTNIHKAARSFGGGTGEKTDKLVTEAKWSAEEVAKVAIDEMLVGRLYIIPQTDGKILWRAKRALGQNFYGMVRAALKQGVLEALLK
ncbi:MAG: SDR family NAD(P)-dependent oxidoreductase [Myxococcales bacterium]|nr:SDR family NAD(P)-dependent oxidoreductase [Polyangiaceae bacterium]MDW8248387.1 SDR family NAD(P)-dependent oxidoreductase [Myxococcales bacterium]